MTAEVVEAASPFQARDEGSIPFTRSNGFKGLVERPYVLATKLRRPCNRATSALRTASISASTRAAHDPISGSSRHGAMSTASAQSRPAPQLSPASLPTSCQRHEARDTGQGDRHKTAKKASPTDDERVKAVRGAKRSLGVAPRKLQASTSEKTIGMATQVGLGLAGLRDRAIQLLAFALAARRSELVTLNVEDLEFCDEGIRVRGRS
jgi:hypothetical protein